MLTKKSLKFFDFSKQPGHTALHCANKGSPKLEQLSERHPEIVRRRARTCWHLWREKFCGTRLLSENSFKTVPKPGKVPKKSLILLKLIFFEVCNKLNDKYVIYCDKFTYLLKTAFIQKRI